MEIGEQPLHHGKTEPRLDHQIHRAPMGLKLAAMEGRHGFEAAHTGGSHGNHPPAPLAAGRHGGHQLLAHLHPLAMQLELAEILRFNGAKGAQTHVQGDPGQFNAAGVELGEQFIAEVQSRRWCCHRSGLGGVAGLIALVVAFGVFVDIGRQRDGAIAHQ